MNLSLALSDTYCTSVLSRFGITTVEQLSRLTVLDVFLLHDAFHSYSVLKQLRSQGMAESLIKRNIMSFLPVETVIAIERVLRKNGSAFIKRLFSTFKPTLPAAMKYQLFAQSLKANLVCRNYHLSEKYGIIAYGNNVPHPTSILVALTREVSRPITRTEAKDCLGCSNATLLTYLKEMPGTIVSLSNGHLTSPASFEFTSGATQTIQDFLETRFEFNPEEIEMALRWKAPDVLSANEIKTSSDIKLLIDEFLVRTSTQNWAYDEEDKCYVFEEGE